MQAVNSYYEIWICASMKMKRLFFCTRYYLPNIYARFWCSHISHGIHFGRFTLFVKMKKIEDVRKIQGVCNLNLYYHYAISNFVILICCLRNFGNTLFYISINFGGCGTEKMFLYSKIVTETPWYCNFWRMFLVIRCHAASWRV